MMIHALLFAAAVALANSVNGACSNDMATCATFESAAPFREGFDRYFLNWDKQGRAAYVDGRLRIAPSRHEAFLAYAQQGVRARPFRGPQTIRLRTAGAHPAGTVTLTLVHRDQNKRVKATAPWRGDEAEFRFGLSSADWYHFEMLEFRRDDGRGRIEPFEVLSLEAEARETPAAAIRLDVDAGGPLPFTTDKGAVSLVFTNAAREPIAFTGALVLENFFGERIPVSVQRTLEGRGQLRVPVDLGGAKRPLGVWRVSGTIASGSARADVATRFAVLNENPRTPRLGRDAFKMGINYHMGRFHDEPLRRLTLDALNACGAKLVRAGGFAADACNPQRGVYNFSRTDVCMRELRERGFALNTDCWPNSEWMVTKEQLKSTYPGWIRVRTEKGAMGTYARELARRYGADIEFLETSNEADLWNEGAMTAADYVDYQKEIYEAVKSVCPEIKVLPSAWAAADSSNVQVRRKGFHEAVMAGAKGFYDVHPVHLHSGFSLYMKDLASFFAMRRKIGDDTVPWYPNETAVTSVNGAEDGVAQNVWKKILYSWAHGAVSYIWYNLKATGWSPKDPEQGYGLLTADFHPRAGFAAFSALAHAVSGLDFKGIVQEGKGRFLYRFAGEKGGTRRIVFAGWDGFTDPPFPIRVATDAARATVYDMMGNGRPAEKCAGGFVFPISSVPGVLVLEGATRAEANAEDAANVPLPKVEARVCPDAVDGRAPDFVLDGVWSVRQLYAANPETIARTWKGPKDLSAKIWIGRAEKDLRLRFAVTDDKHVQHSEPRLLYLNDGLQFILEIPGQTGNFEIGLAADAALKPLVHTWITPVGFDAKAVTDAIRLETSRAGDCTVYDCRIPFAALGLDERTQENGFKFNCVIYDDDGIGKSRDKWIEITPGIAGTKDYSNAPYVKFAKRPAAAANGRTWRPQRPAGDATAAVQGAIDDCFRAGGGTVRLAKGVWPVGGLRLRSRVTLHLEAGCRLLGTRDIGRYNVLEHDAVEPVDPKIISHERWYPCDSASKDTFWRYPGNRWNNALIRLYKAQDAAIVGEPGSLIDGDNPYDPEGEEQYRGPLGINAIDCTNLVFRGYTVNNTGNWAHRLADVQGFVFDDVTCLGGHDAVHFNGCDDAQIRNCTFKTGDDCVAGFDNHRVTVRDCYINSSCSAFRFAGSDVLVERCTIKGPGEWGFRGGLTKEQKAAGAPTPPGSALGRNNMLSFFTYYADGTHPIRDCARRIVIRDCTVENADRFLHYNYNNEQWQRGVPMVDITFERVKASGIKMPLCAYGATEGDVKLDLTMRDCEIAFQEPVAEFVRGAEIGSLTLENVTVRGVEGPMLRLWRAFRPKVSAKNLRGVPAEIVPGVGAFAVSGI